MAGAVEIKEGGCLCGGVRLRASDQPQKVGESAPERACKLREPPGLDTSRGRRHILRSPKAEEPE